MFQKYIIYLVLKENLDVYFSTTYSSYNTAKNMIENFLEDYAKRRGKKIVYLSKEQIDNLKKGEENVLYIRKKNSNAVIYSFNIVRGTFYNSYVLEKYGKIGINEFLVQGEEREKIHEDKVKDLHVTNYERGAHVSFVSELKNVLSERENKNKNTIEPEKKKLPINVFISDLIEGKSKLRKVE